MLEEMNTKTIISFLAVFVLMSSLSSGLDIKHILKRLRNPTGIIIGLLCCYGFLPMLSFILILLFNLNGAESIGLLMMSTCPGGTFASISCYLFNADLPLSIAMTTASTILSFIFIAINGALYIPIIVSDNDFIINYNLLLLSICINLFAIIIGLYISYYKYKKIIKLLGISGLSVIILTTIYTIYNIFFNTNYSDLLRNMSSLTNCIISPFIVLIFSYLFGFGISYFFNLSNKQIVSISLQCGNPNVYLSIAILYVTLQNKPNQIELALLMPLLFTIYGTVFTIFFGFYLMKYKFIKPHKKLKYFKESFTKLKSFTKNKNKNKNKNDDINDDDNSNQDEYEIFKQKCKNLISNVPESTIQPQKIIQYQHYQNKQLSDDDDDVDGVDDDDDVDDVDDDDDVLKVIKDQTVDQDDNSNKGYTIVSDSDSDTDDDQ